MFSSLHQYTFPSQEQIVDVYSKTASYLSAELKNVGIGTFWE